MSEIITVGFDLAMNVFVASGTSSILAHGVNGSGQAVLLKRRRREQVLEFLGQFAPCVVAGSYPAVDRSPLRGNGLFPADAGMSHPKPRAPASPIPSSSARSCRRPPT